MKKSLIEAVCTQLGDTDRGQLRDIANNGATGGFNGFIYYRDTVKFHDDNESDIWDLLEETRQSIGSKSIMEIVAGFNDQTGIGSMDQLKNALAWFALEEVARYLLDNPSEMPESVTDEEEGQQ